MIDVLLAFQECMERPFWTPAHLRKYQDGRLRSLVAHAYRNVPYYRRLFERAGVTPADIRTIDDLHKIPVSTKQDFLAVPLAERIDATLPARRLRKSTTSGSTGMPFEIVERRGSLAKKFLDHRGLFLCGYGAFDRMAQFEDPSFAPKSEMLIQRLGMFKKFHISIFDEQDAVVRKLRSIRPDVVYGYPSNLRMAALGILAQNVADVRPHLVLTTSEVLDEPTRAIINGIFGVELFDVFGTSEFGPFAWECVAHDGYHLSQDIVYTEFMKDGRTAAPGAVADLVCTGFENGAMPLIRYRIGDTGIFDEIPCPCGQRFPKMAVVAGRCVDFIRLGDRALPPYIFTCLMEGIPGILQYQVVQTGPMHIEVRLAAAGALRAQAEAEIRRRYEQRFGTALAVCITPDRIEKEPNGKFKVVKCLVAP